MYISMFLFSFIFFFLHFIILHVGCTTIILLVAPHGFDFDGDFFLSKY